MGTVVAKNGRHKPKWSYCCHQFVWKCHTGEGQDNASSAQEMVCANATSRVLILRKVWVGILDCNSPMDCHVMFCNKHVMNYLPTSHIMTLTISWESKWTLSHHFKHICKWLTTVHYSWNHLKVTQLLHHCSTNAIIILTFMLLSNLTAFHYYGLLPHIIDKLHTQAGSSIWK